MTLANCHDYGDQDEHQDKSRNEREESDGEGGNRVEATSGHSVPGDQAATLLTSSRPWRSGNCAHWTSNRLPQLSGLRRAPDVWLLLLVSYGNK